MIALSLGAIFALGCLYTACAGLFALVAYKEVRALKAREQSIVSPKLRIKSAKAA